MLLYKQGKRKGDRKYLFLDINSSCPPPPAHQAHDTRVPSF